MDEPVTKNIFISHIHEDDARLPDLKKLLADNGCDARDASINSSNPNNATEENYIKYEILAPQIRWASVLVVLLTPDTKDSMYVNWEIEYARKMGKRIIGVWDHGESGCEVPPALDEYADAIVSWRGNQIADAIMGNLNGAFNRDGTPCADRLIPRHNC